MIDKRTARAFEALRKEVGRILTDYGEDRPDWQYQTLIIEMVHVKAIRDALALSTLHEEPGA